VCFLFVVAYGECGGRLGQMVGWKCGLSHMYLTFAVEASGHPCP